jgi:hypothetical protein
MADIHTDNLTDETTRDERLQRPLPLDEVLVYAYPLEGDTVLAEESLTTAHDTLHVLQGSLDAAGAYGVPTTPVAPAASVETPNGLPNGLREGGSSPYALPPLTSHAGRMLRAVLDTAVMLAETVDAERGQILPEHFPGQSGETRGFVMAEATNCLRTRFRLEVEGPKGSPWEEEVGRSG